MDWNIATVWEAVADAVPDELALVQGDRRITWREFDDRAARFASALQALDVEPDTKVALYLYNCNEYIEATFAILKVRTVSANVNYRYLEDELTYLLDNADAEVLIFHGSLGPQVDAVRDQLPKLRALVQVDDGSPLVDGAVFYEDAVAHHEPMARIERSGDDLWFLYTGGTTGMPKGVMWRNEDLFGALAAIVYPILGLAVPGSVEEAGALAAHANADGRPGIIMPASPLMHGTGLMTAMQVLFVGGEAVMLDSRKFDAHELWRTVERERVTHISIVGDAFAKPMIEALDEASAAGKPYDLSSLLVVVSSGVMWSAETKAELMKRYPVMCIDTLGSSEGVGFGSSISEPGHAGATAAFSIGEQARVLTDDGREVTPGSGEVGVLALKGFIPLGYYKDPDKTTSTFRVVNGVRYSIPGDWATVEADHTITLLGRGSVSINTGGEKIYPEEVEEAVKAVPGVRDSVVVGTPDERFGEVVTAVVSLEPGSSVTDEEVKEAGGTIARFKRPRRVVVVDEVVRGPNGKADYAWAKRIATEGVTRGG